MALVLFVVAAAAAVSPDVRHLIAVSFVRQPARYVELYFTDEQGAQTCPRDVRGRLSVRATVRSHLADAQDLPWRARFARATRSGTVRTEPGGAATFRVSVPAGRDAGTLRIDLPGRSEHLVLHCAGATR